MAVVDPTKGFDLPKFDKRILDLTGRKFGRWTVVSFAGRTAAHKIAWNCVCDCGNQSVLSGNVLVRCDGSRSCGCLRRDRSRELQTRHGFSGTPEYTAWRDMIRRCHNPGMKFYQYYGGRGITVCDEWRESFPCFLGDMGQRPGRGFTLDRIDNDGGYSPGNCRWATRLCQANNRRRARPRATLIIEFQGMRKSLAEWSEYLGVLKGTIAARRSRGFSIEQVFSSGKLPRGSRKH